MQVGICGKRTEARDDITQADSNTRIYNRVDRFLDIRAYHYAAVHGRIKVRSPKETKERR